MLSHNEFEEGLRGKAPFGGQLRTHPSFHGCLCIIIIIRNNNAIAIIIGLVPKGFMIHSAVRLVGWPQHPSIVSRWSINNYVFPLALAQSPATVIIQSHKYTLSFHQTIAQKPTTMMTPFMCNLSNFLKKCTNYSVISIPSWILNVYSFSGDM